MASSELNEPYETVLYARRESSLSEALEHMEARLDEAGWDKPRALGDLLVAALGQSVRVRTVWWAQLGSNQ